MMDSGDKVVLPGSPSNGHHGGARPPEAQAQLPEAQAQLPVAQAQLPVAAGPPAGAAAAEHGELAEGAAGLAGGADALLGPSPFVGLGLREALGGLRSLGAHALREPLSLVQGLPRTGRELARIGLGSSPVGPARADKRFADPAWDENLLLRRLMQAYLYLGSEVDGFVEGLGIEGQNAERVRFLLGLLREAMAPTNSLLTNPAAIKRCIETGGGSLLSGLGNWVSDLRHNHGMPLQVDRAPFRVGENLAVTPGSVIHRT
jgi:polyhydroxyalkanoate synthase